MYTVLFFQYFVSIPMSNVLPSEEGTFEIALPNQGFTCVGSEVLSQQYEWNVYGLDFGVLRSVFEYMVACIQRQTQPKVSTIEGGYAAVRLVEAALQSARTGQWVLGDIL